VANGQDRRRSLSDVTLYKSLGIAPKTSPRRTTCSKGEAARAWEDHRVLTAAVMRFSPGVADERRCGGCTRNIRGFAVRTPAEAHRRPPRRVTIYLKLENLQPLGSSRSACAHVLKTMDPNAAARRVDASAGNFGQGLAFAAREIGVPASVVVPEGSAPPKRKASPNWERQ